MSIAAAPVRPPCRAGAAALALLLAVALLAVALLAVAAGPAAAHAGDASLRVVLDPIPSELEDLQIEIVNSIAAELAVGNPTQDDVEVLDAKGVPFFRIGPEGVEANLDASAFYLVQDPLGAIAVPERARGDGDPPAWGRLSTASEWGWFDHRLHPQLVTEIDPTARGAGTEIATFAIPLRFRGATSDVTGAIVYQPLTGILGGALRDVPDVAGLDVTLLPGRAPGLFLDNGTGETVEVTGQEGEPFLRLTPDHVEANLRSRTWYDSGRADRRDLGEEPGELLDPAAAPQWETVAEVPRIGWVEPRAAFADLRPPEAVASTGAAVDLLRWEVPLSVGDATYAIEGVTRFEPFEDAAPAGGLALPGGPRPWAVGGVLVAFLGLELLRRRRARRVRHHLTG